MKIFDKEVQDKILDESVGGGTMNRIRHIILSCYNYNTYGKINLFGAMRNADDDNRELILSIIESFSSRNEDEAFYVVDELAPMLISKGMDKEFLES